MIKVLRGIAGISGIILMTSLVWAQTLPTETQSTVGLNVIRPAETLPALPPALTLPVSPETTPSTVSELFPQTAPTAETLPVAESQPVVEEKLPVRPVIVEKKVGFRWTEPRTLQALSLAFGVGLLIGLLFGFFLGTKRGKAPEASPTSES